MKNNLEIILNDDRWKNEAAFKNSQLIFETAFDFLRKNNEIDFLPVHTPIHINLCLSNDEEVHKLNFEFRKMDKATNVLSFANIDDDTFYKTLQSQKLIELGDIIISLETMKKESEIEKISFENHYAHLLVHGILHLCGFDHIEDDEAEYMENLEIQILSALNIENPYKDER